MPVAAAAATGLSRRGRRQIPLRGPRCTNLAGTLAHYLAAHAGLQFWLRVPVVAPRLDADAEDAGAAAARADDPWEWWNTLRTLCPPSARLGVGAARRAGGGRREGGGAPRP